jgi:hypothetical protein
VAVRQKNEEPDGGLGHVFVAYLHRAGMVSELRNIINSKAHCLPIFGISQTSTLASSGDVLTISCTDSCQRVSLSS